MVLAALIVRGRVVLQPFGDSQRYDLVIDDDGVFTRVQCKTGRLRDGAVRFSTCSNTWHRGGGKQGYAGGADIFAVYCPDNGEIYLVPVGEVGSSEACLRIAPPLNGQRSKVRLASDYLLM